MTTSADDAAEQVLEVIGESLLEQIAQVARDHSVSIMLTISPYDVTVDTPRDPND